MGSNPGGRREPPDTLEVRIRSLDRGRILATLTGAFDHHNAHRLTEALQRALDAGAAVVLLDLSEVTFMDSTGVTRLLLARRSARAAGGHLALIAPSRPVKRLLSITGVDRVLPSYPTPQAVPAAGPEPDRDSGGAAGGGVTGVSPRPREGRQGSRGRPR